MADYNDTICQVLDEELKGNTQLIRDWLKYPHSQSQSPGRNQITVAEVDNPVWYPEKATCGTKLVNVYSKQRQYLSQLAAKNHQKKIQEEEEEETKVR